jgi:hypothetical protein
VAKGQYKHQVLAKRPNAKLVTVNYRYCIVVIVGAEWQEVLSDYFDSPVNAWRAAHFKLGGKR